MRSAAAASGQPGLEGGGEGGTSRDKLKLLSPSNSTPLAPANRAALVAMSDLMSAKSTMTRLVRCAPPPPPQVSTNPADLAAHPSLLLVHKYFFILISHTQGTPAERTIGLLDRLLSGNKVIAL